MNGGAQGGGADGDYKQYMGYQKYVKGGAQGGGAGGDHEQYVDCSKCMQGDARKGGAQTFVAAGNGKGASDKRADDNADDPGYRAALPAATTSSTCTT